MPVQLSCQTCGRELRVRDELAGQEIYCPDCKSILTVPAMVGNDAAMPQYPAESSSQFTDQPMAQTPAPYAELATDSRLPPEREEQPRDVVPQDAPVFRPQSASGGPSIGAIIGGLAMLVGAGFFVLLGLTTGRWIIRPIVILAIAGTVTLIRGISGSISR